MLVWQNKDRHSVTDFRGGSASFVELEAARHAVDRLLVSRQQVSGRKAESFELFGKRSIHIAAVKKGLFESLECRRDAMLQSYDNVCRWNLKPNRIGSNRALRLRTSMWALSLPQVQ